ncbi:MAG TPA: hypothetical protein VFY75_11685 [Solirubrobacterales bacterium]|nr:hypothetical protein [Solirubrobacterales bacterium]
MGDAGDGKRPKVEVPPELFGAVYSTIAARRTAFDTLMWQVPTLGLAAQAFLLTIAYGPTSSQVARCVSGALAAVVAAVAIQTMLKHRANEKTDNLILKEMEVVAGISIGTDANPHDAPDVRARSIENKLIDNRFTQGRSARLWLTSLLCFGIAGLAAVGLALADPSVLQG